MKRSDERILTTHTGSLPRPTRLVEMLLQEEQGHAVDKDEMTRVVRDAIAEVVQNQLAAGIDIGNDGEQPRVGFQTYVPLRMRGFGGESKRGVPTYIKKFPKYADLVRARGNRRAKILNAPQAIAEVAYEDFTALHAECDSFRTALDGHPEEFVEPFMTAASPGIITTTMLNAHYASHEDYLMAVAREMRKEYEIIVNEGFLLQIDAPDLAMERNWFYQDEPLHKFQELAELHIEAINLTLENIPPERVRLHVCWGNLDAPHTDDVALEDVLSIIAQAKVGALCIPFANPRHAHEIAVIAKSPIPANMVLIAGVIDSTTNYAEHPELVAQRIQQAVAAMGDRSRVIAGSDCGFGTFADSGMVAEDVVWEKLKMLRAGAHLASQRLW